VFPQHEASLACQCTTQVPASSALEVLGDCYNLCYFSHGLQRTIFQDHSADRQQNSLVSLLNAPPGLIRNIREAASSIKLSTWSPFLGTLEDCRGSGGIMNASLLQTQTFSLAQNQIERSTQPQNFLMKIKAETNTLEEIFL